MTTWKNHEEKMRRNPQEDSGKVEQEVVVQLVIVCLTQEVSTNRKEQAIGGEEDLERKAGLMFIYLYMQPKLQ